MYTTSRGRTIVKPDFVQLAGMATKDAADINEEVQSIKSTKSTRSRRSRKSDNKQEPPPKNHSKSDKKPNSTKSAQVDEKSLSLLQPAQDKPLKEVDCDGDSRLGDFDDDDVISLGSDASKMDRINNEIQSLEPSMMERYNNYKVQQGELCRLEDSELPDELEKKQVYEESMKQHKEQLKATEHREVRAKRRSKLVELREEIIVKRESAKYYEMEAQLKERRSQLERRQLIIKQRREKMEIDAMWKIQDEEWRQVHDDYNKQEANHGKTLPDEAEHAAQPIVNKGSRGKTTMKSTINPSTSHPSPTITEPQLGSPEAEIQLLQDKARMLIQKKLVNRNATSTSAQPTASSAPAREVTASPRKGVQHLRKLQLIPDSAGGDHSTEDEMETPDMEDDINNTGPR